MRETATVHVRRLGLNLLMIGTAVLVLACENDSTPSSALNVDVDWTLDSQPFLDVTGVEVGKDSLHLYRIGEAVFTAAEEFVLTLEDASTKALVAMDLEGNLLATSGGPGYGPGQYRDISNLLRSRRGVAVWDRLNRRLTVNDRDLDVTEMVRFDVPPDHEVVALFGSSILISTPKAPEAVKDNGRRYYTWRASIDSPSVFTGPVEAADGRVVLQYTSPSQATPISFHTTLAPFCLPAILHAQANDQFAAVETGAGRVWMFNNREKGQQIFQTGAHSIVSLEMLEGVREQFEFMERRLSRPVMGPAGPVAMERGEFTDGAVDSVLRLIGEPGDRLPSHWDKIMPDSHDRLWLRRAKCRSSLESYHTWDVIDVEGNHLATAATPSNFDLKALSKDYALGVELDEYDVEHLLVFKIRRP